MSYDERGRVEALLRYTENIGFDAVYYTWNSMNQVVGKSVLAAIRTRRAVYVRAAGKQHDETWDSSNMNAHALPGAILAAIAIVLGCNGCSNDRQTRHQETFTDGRPVDSAGSSRMLHELDQLSREGADSLSVVRRAAEQGHWDLRALLRYALASNLNVADRVHIANTAGLFGGDSLWAILQDEYQKAGDARSRHMVVIALMAALGRSREGRTIFGTPGSYVLLMLIQAIGDSTQVIAAGPYMNDVASVSLGLLGVIGGDSYHHFRSQLKCATAAELRDSLAGWYQRNASELVWDAGASEFRLRGADSVAPELADSAIEAMRRSLKGK